VTKPLSARALTLATAWYREGLMPRDVIARLAQVGYRASTSWLYKHLRRQGVLRTKSESARLTACRKRGRDYGALELTARSFDRAVLTNAEIARRLRVSPEWVGGVLGPSSSPVKGQALRSVFLRRRRRESVMNALALRADGLSYRQVSDRLEVSAETIRRWCRESGLEPVPRCVCGYVADRPRQLPGHQRHCTEHAAVRAALQRRSL
jgi:Homeodomain-like domain